MASEKKTLKFPQGFLFGTSTAAHQVEGNNISSDWWEWEQADEKREKSGAACNHYELFAEDFALIKDHLGNNAHRLSLEWARLEPKEGEFSEKEVIHYRSVLQKLKDLGITTVVTLHHFTNPSWFAKKGGFEHRRNIPYFAKYVQFCVDNFSDLIDYYVTINEPLVYIGASYFDGDWPPNKKSFPLAMKVMLNLVNAHKTAYRMIHQKLPEAKVGLTMNVGDILPETGMILDRFVTWFLRLLINDLFFLLSKKQHDFIGIDYYQHYNVAWNKIAVALNSTRGLLLKEDAAIQTKTDIDWNICPEGLYRVVKHMAAMMKVPIMIAENGIADRSDGKRIAFIRDHLEYLHKAISEGVAVIGYFHWSLIDNFEWALGWEPKFGLFSMDRETFKRTPRPSAQFYGEICKSGELELLK